MKVKDKGFMLDKILENEALQVRDWLNARWTEDEQYQDVNEFALNRWYISLPQLRQFLLGNRPISIYTLFIMCQGSG